MLISPSALEKYFMEYLILVVGVYLKEECRLRLFENRILRRIFGPKRDENGDWRRLRNEELHSLYSSPNILRVIKSRRLRWAGNVARMEESRSCFKILTGSPRGMRMGSGEGSTIRNFLVCTVHLI